MSPADFRARMVGGKDSKRGWWPWQIGLYRTSVEGKLKLDVVVFVCGEYGKMTSDINAAIVSKETSFSCLYQLIRQSTCERNHTEGLEGPIFHVQAAF